MKDLKLRLTILLYGREILHAMSLDHLLHLHEHEGQRAYQFDSPKETLPLFDLHQDLDFLVTDGYLIAYQNNYYDISVKGKLMLAKGGFTAEAKQSKNALYAFRVSLTALSISLVSLLLSIYRR